MITETDFIVADSHFGHSNICLHTSRLPWISDNPAYAPSRPFHFKKNNPYLVNLRSHNAALITNWNAIVPKKGSRVIIVGDFAYNDHKQFLQNLNGEHKVFVMGNHDDANNDFYNMFKDKPQMPEDMYDLRKECNSFLKRLQDGNVDLQTCADGILSAAWAKFANINDWEMADQMSRECMNIFDDVHEMGFRTRIQKQDVTFCHYAMKSWASSFHGSWNVYGHSHGRMPELDNVLSIDGGVDVWGYSPVPWCAIVEKMKRKEAWMRQHGKYPVDGESKGVERYSIDMDERVLQVRAENKEIMRSLGYPINEAMWPTEVLKWPKVV